MGKIKVSAGKEIQLGGALATY